MSREDPAVLLTADLRPRRGPGDRPAPRAPSAAPPVSVPAAARLWLVASLALWAVIALAVRLLLG
jgi:hypothetical protein